MSGVAASAASLSEFVDETAGEIPRRRRLRSVPEQADPAVQLKLGNPLQLSKTMRVRLLGAVRALVCDPVLARASDGARLASVVLMAKAAVRHGYRTDIWAEELARWLGVSRSTVAHTVLPELRRAEVLGSNVATNEFGHATGLECWVVPMYQAQKAGDRRHALALSRSELAVLLRLIEVLFGPGWAPKDKAPVPAGLLASRTGRGAATDRLGLLLMVLSTNSRGWLQLCAGSVDTSRGRPAVTVARLLGCSLAGGAKVLSRLQEQGVADVVRQETGSGLKGKSRVRLVAVAEAHGRAVREARVTAPPVFSDLAATAFGDHEVARGTETLVFTGVSNAGDGVSAGVADLAAAAQLHASHASVVTAGGSLSLSGRFSGEGRGDCGDRPECARPREDQGSDAAAGTELPVSGAEGGPLRGEKQVKFRGGSGETAARAADRSRLTVVDGGRGRQPQGVADLPDLGLRVALAPVADLWARLSRGQQAVARRAALQALEALSGIVDERVAPQLLADRLTDRLDEAGGEALVREPMGWLLGRGLVQRSACPDPRCDDGIRLGTGGDCPRCEDVVQGRRAWRSRITAEVDERMPGADSAGRRAAIESGLRRQSVIEAEDAAIRRAKAEAEQSCRQAACAVAEARGQTEHKSAAAAEALVPAESCADCGAQHSSGLCEACGYRREARRLVAEAGLIAAAWSADLGDAVGVQVVVADVRASLERDAAAAQERFLRLMDPAEIEADRQGVDTCLAFNALQAVQAALPEHRQKALAMLTRTPEAESEARRAYVTEQGRRQHRRCPDGPVAVTAAEQAADMARERTAQHLLATRLGRLRELTGGRADAAATAAAPWAERLAPLADRP
ncbi:hypothetical protein ABZ504_51510, partial [Streptomyces mirabilis]|uniref:hypothetical protein n=1 Tax=Streptomyces mirabilis TaxID=68239 RepID=UPI0033F2958E